MSFVAVTIHKGELKQIRRSIETAKAKHVEGRLYGLWTHSDQPVIQFVVGPCPGKEKKTKEYFEKCDKYLGENHGLKHIGNWSTKPAEESVEKSDLPCFVRMLVSLSEDTLQVDMRVIWKDPYVNQKAEEGEEPGVLEQLDGESPFRLFSSLTKEIADMAGCAPADIRPDLVDRPLKVNSPDRPVVLKPADVKEEQWYSTEEGMQLFGKIHAALRVNGIAVIETSRDTQTHDIGFTLQLDQHSFRVEFPRNFPRGMASLTEGRKRVNIDLKEVDASSKRARTSAEEEPPKEQHKDGAKFEGDPPQEKECSLQDHDKLSQHLIEKIKRQLSLKVTAAGRHDFGTPV